MVRGGDDLAERATASPPMIAALLALAVAAGGAQTDDPEPPAREVVFARASHGGWSMEGRTVVNEGYAGRPGIPGTKPTIEGMYCFAERNGLHVQLHREYGLSLWFEARVRDNGVEHTLRDTRLRALVLDGTMWEAHLRSEGDFATRFTDVAYSGPGWGPANVYRSLAVRRSPSPVWLPLSALADDLLRSRLLRLGFRPGEHDAAGREEDPMVWVDVPLDGLSEALVWCQRAMVSPAAFRLHPPGIEQPASAIRR